MFTIIVPGSSANLGPGFDSIGLAVSKYLTLDVYPSDTWHFESASDMLKGVPTGKENMMYQVAEQIAKHYGKELPPCRVVVHSEIPLARGLGSSASAIIAAIELANQLLGDVMTVEEKLRFSCLLEGHPDNVAASLYGGLIVGVHSEEETFVLQAGIPSFELIALIPDFELKTEEARGVLPKELPYATAIRGSAVSNVLLTALMQENYELAGKMMEEDVFHEPYRQTFLPHFTEIRSFVKEQGAFAMTLSGAGPTLLVFVPKGMSHEVSKKVEDTFSTYTAHPLQVDEKGVVVLKNHTVSV